MSEKEIQSMTSADLNILVTKAVEDAVNKKTV